MRYQTLEELFEDLELAARKRITQLTGKSDLPRCRRKKINILYRGKIQEAIHALQQEASFPLEDEELQRLSGQWERSVTLLLEKAAGEIRLQPAQTENVFSNSGDWFGYDGIRPVAKRFRATVADPVTGDNDWLFRNFH